MAARIAAVLLGYLFYRWVADDQVWAGLMVWAGFILTTWILIDTITRPRHERLELLQVGSIALGLGLLGTGVYLALR
jgi:hypothetical protein